MLLISRILMLLLCGAIPGVAQSPPSLPQKPVAEGRTWLKGVAHDWRSDTDASKGVPAPAAKATKSALIALPDMGSLDLPEVSVFQALNQRRSRRDFMEDALSLAELGILCWSTQGETARAEQEGQSYRTAPSAGGRHPVETYLLVSRVEDLKPGLYRYVSRGHALEKLRGQAGISEALQAACYNQSMMARAPVVFAWSAVPYRTEWKYAQLAPRMIAMEAGHIAQNLYLGAEALGLGTCAMLAYDSEKLDALLGLDGIEEFAIYIAPVGKVD